MGFIRSHTLYDSALVRVEDIQCRPADGACGAEEHALYPAVAVVRAGVFCKHVGRHEWLADANHAVFFTANEPYRVSHPVTGGDDCSSFEFAPEVLADAAGSLGYDPADRTPRFKMTHVLLSPVACMLETVVRRRCLGDKPDPMAVEEASIWLLGAVCQQVTLRGGIAARAHRASTRRAHRVWADRARVFMAERYAFPVTLRDVAKAVSCSPFHLARIFRRETGLPMHRYLMRLRLREAVNRLAVGWEDLTTLALELGFSSHAHFSDAFRSTFGCSPSAFREGPCPPGPANQQESESQNT